VHAQFSRATTALAMTRPRRTLVSSTSTPYYHCMSRCVRRAFLCGQDALTGKNFDHRRVWIVERLAILADVFAIDVCAYAVMSNHLHLTVKLDSARPQHWEEAQVVERWTRLFRRPPLIQRWYAGEKLSEGESDKVQLTIRTWRQRLADLSWFMRCLKEHIARAANREDGCTGHFWEGRFKSQALLDPPALLTNMVYVDLNPIRAGVASTPEGSDFTSVQARARRLGRHMEDAPPPVRTVRLARFSDELGSDPALPFNSLDYLNLIDWSARIARAGKAGALARDAPTILERLGIQKDPFASHVVHASKGFHAVIGRAETMRSVAGAFGRVFFKGTRYASLMFS
jgi:REP element-mobilizing transposase RayT